MKDRKTAALLAIFLGFIGAHHLYLKKYILAIIYILLAATAISLCLGIIEGLILFFGMSDEEFNSRYNDHPSEKKLEHDVDTITESEENYLLDFLHENEYKKQEKIKNFKYDSRQVPIAALQVLESLYIIDTTKNFDTLKGRSEFIEQKLDFLKIASSNSRYLTDIQIGIDQYKTIYYDKIISQQQISVLLKPNDFDYDDFICISMLKSFKRFYLDQINQIGSLKQPSAIKKRREKIMDLIEEIRNNIPTIAKSYEITHDELDIIYDKIYAETYE